MNELDQLFKIAISQPKKKRFGFALIVGTVKQIDGDTCIVDDYEDVRLNAVIDNLESQFTVYPKVGSKVIIGKLDVDNNDDVVTQFGIRNIPTILFFKDGKVVDKQVGAAPKATFVTKIDAIL